MAQEHSLAVHYANMTLNWSKVLAKWDEISPKVYSPDCRKVKEFTDNNPCIMDLFDRSTVKRTDGEQSAYVYAILKDDFETVHILIQLEKLLIPACRDIFEMAMYLDNLKEYLPYVPYNPRRPYVHCNPI